MSEELQSITSPDDLKRFHQLVGGVRVANKIREAIGSQTMKALEQIQQQELYRAEGFSTFADFLNESPYSPMDKNKYYRLKEFYKNESPEEFDLLNSLSPSVAERRLLKAGDIVLDGEKVIVSDTPYAINDKAGIKKAIKRLIENYNLLEGEKADLGKAIAKQEKQIEELQAAPPPSQLPDSDISLLTQGITKIAAGFSDLIAGIRELNADDFKGFKKKHARRVDSIVEAYGEFLTTHKPTARATEVVEEDDDLSDEELQGFLED